MRLKGITKYCLICIMLRHVGGSMVTVSLPAEVEAHLKLTSSKHSRVLDMPYYQARSNATFINEKTGTRKVFLSVIDTNFYMPTGFECGALTTKSYQVAFDNTKKMDPNWLGNNYELAVEMNDCKCDAAMAIQGFVRKMRAIEQDAPLMIPFADQPTNDDYTKWSFNRLPISILSHCTVFGQEIGALVAREYNFVPISPHQVATRIKRFRQQKGLLNGKKRYDWLITLADWNDVFAWGIAHYCKSYNWNKVAILSEIHWYYSLLDDYFLQAFEATGITVTFMTKVSFGLPSDDELNEAMAEMSTRHPRIIALGTDSLTRMACFLHRFGLYGPSYVFFSSSWSYIQIEDLTGLPKWCTQSMLAEVFQSVFLYGMSPLSDAIEGYVDTTGNNFQKVYDDVHAKINEFTPPEQYSTCIPYTYDRGLTLSLILNSTETILRKTRNETLSDWVAGSINHRENPEIFLKILREASSERLMNGFYGAYQTDPITGDPSGFFPTTFTQLRIVRKAADGGLKLQFVLVSFYKQKPLSIIHSRPTLWTTEDGQPPLDTVRVIEIAKSPMTSSSVIALMITAGIGIFSIGLLAYLRQLSKYLVITRSPVMQKLYSFSTHDKLILTGDMLLLASVFALPLGNVGKQVTFNCSALACFVVLGYTLAMTGISLKIDRGILAASQGHAREVRGTTAKHTKGNLKVISKASTSKNSSRGTIGSQTNASTASVSDSDRDASKNMPPYSEHVVAEQSGNGVVPIKTGKRSERMFMLTWFLVMLTLILLSIFISPMKAERHSFEPQVFNHLGYIYQPYSYECKLVPDPETYEGTVILGILGGLQAIYLLRTCFMTDVLRHSLVALNETLKKKMRLLISCVYCELLLLAAGAIVALMKMGDFEASLVLTSSITICFCALNMIFTIIAKLT